MNKILKSINYKLDFALEKQRNWRQMKFIYEQDTN